MPEAERSIELDTIESAPTIVALPSLGADMDVGTVIEWSVAVGDRVERGDVVAIVSTEKADIDVETWDSGWVIELIAQLDQELPVGEPLLALDQTEPSAAPLETQPPAPVPTLTSAPRPVALPVEATDSNRRSIRASPRARRLAADHEVALADLIGSGPAGAIVADDVLGAGGAQVAASESVQKAEAPTQPATKPSVDPMRRAIADRMTRANREIPHYHLESDIELSAALDWLSARNADRPIAERVVPAAMLACAVARAAARVPQCNGSWIDDHFEGSDTVELGLVVSLRNGGLLTPTIASADTIGLDAMMNEIRAMVAGARSGQLRSRWTRPASITLTNLGDLGADRVAGIIFPPQVALIGFGRIVDRPWVVDDVVVPRPVVTATLSADHRASDGADGSRLLGALVKELAAPENLDV